MRRRKVDGARKDQAYYRFEYWDPYVLAELERAFEAKERRLHETTEELIQWAEEHWPEKLKEGRWGGRERGKRALE